LAYRIWVDVVAITGYLFGRIAGSKPPAYIASEKHLNPLTKLKQV